MVYRTLCSILILWFSAYASASDLKIVTWNVSPSFYEALPERKDDFRRLADELKPDILVLVEITGDLELKQIAEYLGWERYFGIATNQSIAKNTAFTALETAIISRIPIKNVVEYDVTLDGHHEVFTEKGLLPGLVTEEELSSEGIKGFGQTLGNFDRGSMRVDIGGELTIYPVHLKSNRNNECFDLGDAIKFFKRNGFSYDSSADSALTSGFERATARRITNAEKRERVIAAISRVAASAIKDGRVSLIAGDFNTAFEDGKYGQKIEDCKLKDFSCAKTPFPSAACTRGDGFDDTLGLLEAGLVDGQKWIFLSKEFGRTYEDKKFADAAIDHMAVNEESIERFKDSYVAKDLYGSDHFPIVTTFESQQ